MAVFPCPNHACYCSQNSGTPTVPVVAASGNVYMFHQNCLRDVQTGWSGHSPFYLSSETFDQMYRRVMRTNFAVIGVVLEEPK